MFDTWWGAPRVVRQSVAALRKHTPYYSYVSSCAVYRADPLPHGVNEDFPTVEADSSADRINYAVDKRGAELAILEGFGLEGSFLARPGIILGPYEIPGRVDGPLRRYLGVECLGK